MLIWAWRSYYSTYLHYCIAVMQFLVEYSGDMCDYVYFSILDVCPLLHWNRGNLTLSLLPTSDLRISFLGDDGHVERLSTLRSNSDCSSVTIEGISADNCGRSFMIRVPTIAEPFYFWCSEKSLLLGKELLDKVSYLVNDIPMCLLPTTKC